MLFLRNAIHARVVIFHIESINTGYPGLIWYIIKREFVITMGNIYVHVIIVYAQVIIIHQRGSIELKRMFYHALFRDPFCCLDPKWGTYRLSRNLEDGKFLQSPPVARVNRPRSFRSSAPICCHISYCPRCATSQFSEARVNRQIISDPSADRPELVLVKIYYRIKSERKIRKKKWSDMKSRIIVPIIIRKRDYCRLVTNSLSVA